MNAPDENTPQLLTPAQFSGSLPKSYQEGYVALLEEHAKVRGQYADGSSEQQAFDQSLQPALGNVLRALDHDERNRIRHALHGRHLGETAVSGNPTLHVALVGLEESINNSRNPTS